MKITWQRVRNLVSPGAWSSPGVNYKQDGTRVRVTIPDADRRAIVRTKLVAKGVLVTEDGSDLLVSSKGGKDAATAKG